MSLQNNLQYFIHTSVILYVITSSSLTTSNNITIASLFHSVPPISQFPPSLLHFQTEVNSLLLTDRNPYHQRHVLSPNYILEWTADWSTRTIIFNVTASTSGYIGFGLSLKGLMANADIIVGGISATGDPYFSDMHGSPVGNAIEADVSQDFTLLSVWEDSNYTSIRFSRPFDTCDDKEDIAISPDDTVVLLWSYGESDNISYHFNNRGSLCVHLLDPDWTPVGIERVRMLSTDDNFDDSLKALRVWTITKRQRVPPVETSYWCSFHKGPVLSKNHHAVGFHFRWENNVQFTHMHHVLLFKCTAPEDQDPSEFFEPYVQNNTGGMCFFPVGGNQSAEGLPTEFCRELIFPYVVGQRMFFFPSHVGITIGSTPNEYYLLKVHHDNSNKLSNLHYMVNIDIYYTPVIRPNEAAIITMGHHSPGAPGSLLIPPASMSHSIYGHCGSECTREMIPAEGIKIFAVQHHSHDAGVKQRLHHYRGNRELPWISKDDNYHSGFQNIRMLRNEVIVMPGDHIVTRCEFDSTGANGSSIPGGFSRTQEMCLVYVWYYGKMNEYSLCRSEIRNPDFVFKHLSIKNWTWSESDLEHVTGDGENRMTVSEIANAIQWTIEKRMALQSDHQNVPQIYSCDKWNANNDLTVREDRIATLPNVQSQYVRRRDERCGGDGDDKEEDRGLTRIVSRGWGRGREKRRRQETGRG